MRRVDASAGGRLRAFFWQTLALIPLLLACATPGRSHSSGQPVEVFDWQLPAGFPKPEVPADNPMSAAKVRLGRSLFYDSRLSGSGHFSCSSCHRQELAFTDGRDRSIGATGEIHPRGAMSLTNVAYNSTYNWANPTLTGLEQQALNPMLNQDPIELGIAGRETEVIARLESDSRAVTLFEQAFPRREISIETITKAIAAFERTLISGNSDYDRWLFWGEPLGDAEAHGMELFFSERLRCSECHAGLNLSGPVRAVEKVVGGRGRKAGMSASKPRKSRKSGRQGAEPGFHNTGLFDEDGVGAYPVPNRGVFEITKRAKDMGRFRAPTLRNIEVTAPYMHDGSLATLDEVVRFYAAGGRGPGRESPLKSKFLRGFELDARERSDLISFLKALTDREFLTARKFAAPKS